MRLLLTDVVFPSKYAKWRLVAIQSFIEKYETDILIPSKIGHYVIPFGFDYKELLQSHSLSKYDILIFNPGYNYLNEYNSGDFDGRQYNSKLPFDYMFQLRKHRQVPLDLRSYDAVYHIFLICFHIFSSQVSYPRQKQYIHLYPGGGVSGPASLTGIHGSVNLIGTQHFITSYVKQLKWSNPYLESYGGSFMNRNEVVVPKRKNTGTLNICFTSIGLPDQKGVHIYAELIRRYLTLYPSDNIKFFCAGENYRITNATYLGLLSQNELDVHYREKIDILLNLDTGIALNGFPLGVEGLIQGVILFTPDYHNSNRNNGFDFGPELQIIKVNETTDIITRLKVLHDNRDLLHNYSQRSQEKAVSLFRYEVVMEGIFRFIQTTLNMDFRDRSNPGYPSGALGCLQYTFREDSVNTQCLTYSRELIKSYARKIESGLIVEIGILGGATLLDLVGISGAKLVGIDPFEKIAIYNGLSQTDIDSEMVKQTQMTYKFNRENLDRIIKKYQLENVITIIPEPSEVAVSSIKDGSINLLHIDGDHSTEGVYRDLTNYYPKMVKPGGIIIGDDFNWKSVADALKKFCSERNLTFSSIQEKFIIQL